MATRNTRIVNQPFPAAALSRRTVRTLLVDDTPAILELFSSVLGADSRIDLVGTAADGLTAVALAQAEHPDLILMDVNMPTMNGLKAAMHIKARLPETRILLMSSDDGPEVAMAAMDCGADGFIPKRAWTMYAWHVDRLFFRLK